MVLTKQVGQLIINLGAVLYGTGSLSDFDVHICTQCLLGQSGIVP